MIQCRDVEIVLVGLILGPPLAAILYLALTATLQHGPQGLLAIDPAFIGSTLPFFYLIAWLPAVAVALVNAVAARFLRTEWLRLLFALPIGAVAFSTIIGWLAQLEDGSTDYALVACLAAAGAISSLICLALIEAFGTRPRQSN